MTKAIFAVSQQSTIHGAGDSMVAVLEHRFSGGHGMPCTIAPPSGNPILSPLALLQRDIVPIISPLVSVEGGIDGEVNDGAVFTGIDFIPAFIANVVSDCGAFDRWRKGLARYQLGGMHKHRSGRYSHASLVPEQN
jgi:hypothetical protein